MKSTTTQTAFCLTLCAFTGQALAQSPAQSSNSNDSLQEVVVTAKSLEVEIPQQLAQFGTRVDTVTSEQILTGGYLDVASTLQNTAPGIYITSDNGPFDYVNVSLQGSRTEDVLWLVDGVRINNRLYASTTPLDTIPASIIDHVEVLDGGQALYYGTQAIAGAVNIVTKSFTDVPAGAFSLGGDTNGGRRINGYFSDAIQNNDFVVYATHDQSSGIQPYPTADYQPSGTDRRRDYKVTTVGAKYAYDFSDALAFSASYNHTNADLGFASPTVENQAYNQRNEDLVTTKLDYVPSDAFKIYLKDYYHRWSSYYSEVDNGSTAYYYTPGTPAETTVAADEAYWGYKDYGLNLMTEVAPAGGLEYVGGYDYQNYTGRDSELVIIQSTERVNALFAQIRSTPDLIPNTHLAVGLRENIPSDGPSDLIWDTSGRYDLTPSLHARFTAGTSFRLPTDEELFANDPEDERGDPNLKPETSTRANLAFGGKTEAPAGPVNWELIGFWRKIDHLIDFQSFDAATQQEVFGNVPGIVHVHGLEVTLDGALTPILSGSASATYSHARQSGVDYQFDDIPVTQYKASLDFHPAQRYGINVSIVYVGDIDGEPLGQGNGRVGYGDYTTANVDGRLFLDSKLHHRIDLHVDNIFNHVYYSELGGADTDADGTPYVVHSLGLRRTFSATYTYSF